MAQFDTIAVTQYMWPMVRNHDQIDRLIQYMHDTPGIVLFTLVDKELANYLQDKCNQLNMPCISAIESVVHKIENHLNLPARRNIAGWQHANLDDYYFRKIAAIDFSMYHDDGQNLSTINDADILLVGVSRTSKTPTCLYLAQRGFKAANIPYIAGKQITTPPDTIKGPMVIGLTISADRLKQIRQNRILAIDARHGGDNLYHDDTYIRQELKEALQFYAHNGWQVLDVSGKAIEETAAEIINLYNTQTR